MDTTIINDHEIIAAYNRALKAYCANANEATKRNLRQAYAALIRIGDAPQYQTVEAQSMWLGGNDAG